MKCRLTKCLATTVTVLVICLASIVGGCGGYTRRNYVYDFFGEYRFVLPFATHNRVFTGHLNFSTDYTMEQMSQAITDAGYDVRIYPRGYMLISIIHDYRTAFFVIVDGHSRFQLMGTQHHNTFFPIHIGGTLGGNETEFRVSKNFDYIAEFYRRANRCTIIINEVNMTVFVPKWNRSLSPSQLESIMFSWIEDEYGCYWIKFSE